MIYDYCLVVDGELNPYPTYYEKQELVRPFPRKPDVALLQVCSLIKSEAEVVLYGKNVWRLSYMGIDGLMWDVSKKLIRQLTVHFDRRDYNCTERLRDTCADWECLDHDGGDWDVLKRVCHDSTCYRLIGDVWWSKIFTFSGMMLDNLTLDFTNCYCVTGCCRLVEELEHQLAYAWAKSWFDPAVKIVGWLDDLEAHIITEIGSNLTNKGFTCEGWHPECRAIRGAIQKPEHRKRPLLH